MTSKFCTGCGKERVPGEGYCRQCGKALPSEAPPSPPKPKVFCALCGSRVEGHLCQKCGTVVPGAAPKPVDMEELMGPDAKKVMGLLAKAGGTSFPEEAESASRLATEICAKHGVDVERFREFIAASSNKAR